MGHPLLNLSIQLVLLKKFYTLNIIDNKHKLLKTIYHKILSYQMKYMYEFYINEYV